VLPRGLATRAGAASGIIPFRTTAEAWGAVTGLGQDSPLAFLAVHDLRTMRCPSPRKHGLELSTDGSPCESRGRSAGRRARPDMARSRARCISRRRRLLMLRGEWLACAFRRFASL
jgi:hypothetical protein